MLEDPHVLTTLRSTARASLVLPAGQALNRTTELWMGGAHSLVGDLLTVETAPNSWIVDCAGDMDPVLRTAAGEWLACVFADHDGPLTASMRIETVVSQAVSVVRDGNGRAPERIYVMCQHGMNRSGLVSGLIMRALGVDGREAVDRIRLARPGALSNDYFRNMLLRS